MPPMPAGPAVPFGKAALQTLAVFAFIAVLVLGGRLAVGAASAATGPPIKVADNVTVQPLSGWQVKDQDEGVLQLTRGSGNMSVLVQPGVSEPRALTVAYVNALRNEARGGFHLSEPESVSLPNNLKAERFVYEGQFGDGPATVVQGEVTSVVSQSGTGVIFDGFGPPDTIKYTLADIHEMVEKAQVG
jgi:hypothetical protein